MAPLTFRKSRKRRKPPQNITAQLRGLETLPARIVLSGMVNFGPARAEAIPATEETTAETRVGQQEVILRRNTDPSSFASSSDHSPHLRPVNQDPNEPVPVAAVHNHFSASDIPEEMGSRDEVFGGRDFWVMGSGPLDHVSQLFSGPGTEPAFPGLDELLAFDPADLQAPTPIGGPPESNLENILSQMPSLGDLANDGDDDDLPLGGDDDHADDDEMADDCDDNNDTPRDPLEDSLPPKDDWEDVDPPWWSPPWLQALTEFWNDGFSETSGGLSTVTKNLDDD